MVIVCVLDIIFLDYLYKLGIIYRDLKVRIEIFYIIFSKYIVYNEMRELN